MSTAVYIIIKLSISDLTSGMYISILNVNDVDLATAITIYIKVSRSSIDEIKARLVCCKDTFDHCSEFSTREFLCKGAW